MTDVAAFIEGPDDAKVLIVADHASNQVPNGLDLGISEQLFDDHIAVDIGVEPLAAALARQLRCHAVIARYSRLVVDLNRDPHEKAVIPEVSDGYVIPGNHGLEDTERTARIDLYWWPYHEVVAGAIEQRRPAMLLSLHSFTPRLASRPEEKRPWEIGILYNEDDRAASAAIPLFRAQGTVTGDNEPYSGRLLNASMNRHAEARGLPYLGIEVRQDLIDHEAGVARWSERIAAVVEQSCAALA
jgi:predicted N-formylglutamate amidohydrolase